MKKLLLISLFIPIILSAQTNKVKAKLIDYDKTKMPPYCGYSVQYGKLKFKICKDYGQLQKGDTILVIIKCPREVLTSESGNKFYKNNKRFFVTLGNKIIDENPIIAITKPSDLNLPSYETDRIEKIR